MSRWTLCAVLVVVLCAMGVAYAQDGDNWSDRISVSGYFHARYDTGEAIEDGFNFRRMFLNLISNVNDRTMGVITLSRVGPNDPNIDLYNAFVDYKISDEWNVQIGQAPTWFGLEGWEGSSVRLPLDRALILEAGPGFFYKGAPDRGVWLGRKQAENFPALRLGVCNGEFRASDQNTNKTVSADLKWKYDWGQAGLSYLDGKEGPDATETPREAVGAYVRLFPAPWGLQAEWADGEMLGADRDGYYVQGCHAFEDHPGTLFLRWEEMSVESAMMPAQASSSSEYEALHVGYAYQLDANNEITVQWTDAEWTSSGGESSSSSDASYGAIQWQYAFK